LILRSLQGIFPRSEELIGVTRDFDRGRASEEDLKRAYERERELFFNLQKGLDLLYDGLLGWMDLLRPLSYILKPCKVGGLKRYFETNFFYRVLYLEEETSIKEKEIEGWKRLFFHRLPYQGKRFLYFPGPLFVRDFSEGISLRKTTELLLELLNFILGDFDLIWLAEPSIPFADKGDLELLRNFYKRLKSICGSKEVFLQTYFFTVKEVRDYLLSLDVDAIGIDFLRNGLGVLRGWPRDKGLIAGCIDTENSLIERREDIESFIKRILEDYSPKFVVVTGTADWELIPWEIAKKKVYLLKELFK
jgi:methionine synthase II (cobalamin-independent)